MKKHQIVLILGLMLGALLPVYAQDDADSTAIERTALEALYHATDGENWTYNTGWLSADDHCTWYGITCDEDSRVVRIYLFDDNLTGALPSEIGNLTNLEEIFLSNNMLEGLPPEIGDLY